MNFAAFSIRAWSGAVLTGLMLGLAQPKADLAILAWFAWVPLLLAVRGRSPRETAQLAFAAHFVAFAVTLYWIEVVVRVFGHVSVLVSWIPLALLVAYSALWMTLAFWVGRKAELRFPRLPMLLTLPFLLTAAEWVRGVLFTGFPWGHPAYSQTRLLPVIQIADIAGRDGILFVMAFVSCGVAALIFAGRKGKPGRFRTAAPALVAVLLVAATLTYGWLRLDAVRGQMAASERQIRIALLQGNIDQSQKWDQAYRQATLDIYDALGRRAAQAGAELIIWPETAAPFYYRPGQRGYSARIERMVRETGAYTLFGAPGMEFRDGKQRYLNRAYLLNGQAEMLDVYDKVHLVPFSEYIPLPLVFGWVEKLVPVVGSFAMGETRNLLSAGGARFGTLICYESIFPAEVRQFVHDGADFLAVITNDAWFLRTSAPYQHFAMAAMRAVENRVPVMQAGNTGVTGFIDPDGTMRTPLPIFEKGKVVETVRLAGIPSVYTRYGDFFAYGTLLVSFLLIGALVWRRR